MVQGWPWVEWCLIEKRKWGQRGEGKTPNSVLPLFIQLKWRKGGRLICSSSQGFFFHVLPVINFNTEDIKINAFISCTDCHLRKCLVIWGYIIKTELFGHGLDLNNFLGDKPWSTGNWYGQLSPPRVLKGRHHAVIFKQGRQPTVWSWMEEVRRLSLRESLQ